MTEPGGLHDADAGGGANLDPEARTVWFALRLAELGILANRLEATLRASGIAAPSEVAMIRETVARLQELVAGDVS